MTHVPNPSLLLYPQLISPLEASYPSSYPLPAWLQSPLHPPFTHDHSYPRRTSISPDEANLNDIINRALQRSRHLRSKPPNTILASQKSTIQKDRSVTRSSHSRSHQEEFQPQNRQQKSRSRSHSEVKQQGQQASSITKPPSQTSVHSHSRPRRHDVTYTSSPSSIQR